MGADFRAFVRYPGPTADTYAAIEKLRDFSPDELRNVKSLWTKVGFFDLESEFGPGPATWVVDGIVEPELACQLPSLDRRLRTPEAFFLTFGKDSLVISHLLRWRIFLTEERWQRVMLPATRYLARLFLGTECLIASDHSPIWLAFLDGASFDEAVAAAGPDEPEFAEIGDLYFELDDEGTWDSKGYWRLKI